MPSAEQPMVEGQSLPIDDIMRTPMGQHTHASNPDTALIAIVAVLALHNLLRCLTPGGIKCLPSFVCPETPVSVQVVAHG